MVIDFSSNSLWHGLELVKRLAHLLLHANAIVLRHAARQRKLGQVAPDTDAHRQRWETKLGQVKLAILGEALDSLEVPVVHVLGVKGNLVVSSNERKD